MSATNSDPRTGAIRNDVISTRLCRRKGPVVVAYSLGVMVLWGAVVLSEHGCISELSTLFPERFSILGLEVPTILQRSWMRFVSIVPFLALQAVFLLGAGTLTVRRGKRRTWGAVAVALILAAGLSGLVVGAVAIFRELTAPQSSRSFPSSDAVRYLLILWVFWFLVALASLRRRRLHWLKSWLSVLIAGSWIEFVAALPVHIVLRRRNADCPCDTGSWFALLVSVTLLAWSIGPAILIFIVYEGRLNRLHPRRTLRILLEKTSARKD